MNTQLLHKLTLEHPKLDIKYTYGTAGFRFHADKLDSVMFTTGLLAALRSKFHKGKAIGVMVTASHNPPQDNGVKIVEPMGEMLQQSWELYATQLANAESAQELEQILNQVATAEKIDLDQPSMVVIARDSRESGPRLVQSTKDGLSVFGTEIHDAGLLTTPQLHYLVRSFNDKEFGFSTEEGYYKKLANAFEQIWNNYSLENSVAITIDAANGIGGPKVEQLAQFLKEVQFTLVNNHSDKPELLNHECGADFVKTNQKLPGGSHAKPLELLASFDGDADRVVFYYVDENSTFKLLDGDKIASLLAQFFKETLDKANLKNAKLGVVQTAYANGSSTDYMSGKLSIPVECTPTGVKHLHHVAAGFDIGVYFEANGHGTVLFSEDFCKQLAQTVSESDEERLAVDTLLLFSGLINQTVGDAISDLLAVIMVLAIKKWTPKDWDREYTDLPNRLVKVIVPDRYIFQTTNAERQLTSPAGLQEQIDELVAKYPHGRSFVRASGTEDAVRVYAEAGSRAEADELAAKVSELVEKSVC